MSGAAKSARLCSRCAGELAEGANFCPACGTARAEGGRGIGEMLAGFAGGTAEEIKKAARPVLSSATGRKLAAGATLGAVAAVAVPFVSIGAGALVGAGIAALRRRPK